MPFSVFFLKQFNFIMFYAFPVLSLLNIFEMDEIMLSMSINDVFVKHFDIAEEPAVIKQRNFPNILSRPISIILYCLNLFNNNNRLYIHSSLNFKFQPQSSDVWLTQT